MIENTKNHLLKNDTKYGRFKAARDFLKNRILMCIDKIQNEKLIYIFNFLYFLLCINKIKNEKCLFLMQLI